MRSYGRKRDDNERDIILALEAAGAHVQQLDGTGVPDLVVLFDGRLTLVEVKVPKRKDGKGKTRESGTELTVDQAKWWAAWGDPKPSIVHNADEALVAIGALRSVA